jgi:hypothetical protein
MRAQIIPMIKTHWSQSDPRLNILEYEKCSKKIAPSGGRRENCWGFSCEKSRFYAKNHIFPILGGGGRAGCTPLDPPLLMMSGEYRNVISRGLSMMVSDNAGSK